MKGSVLTPLGVRITEDQLPGDVPALRLLLARHGVVVMPGQHIDDNAFLAFLRSFGDLVFTTGETAVEGFPDLNIVSNVGRTTSPRSTFHADSTYLRTPPAYTALRAVDVPEKGGETLFTDQYLAYDTLPKDVRARLTGRTIRHVVTGVELGPDDEREAEHPVFRKHPVSGRTALFLTTPARCQAMSGFDEHETADMIAFLFAHSTREESIFRHSWSTGDVVMWDNGCVLHRADHEDVVGDRVLHRGMVAGYGTEA